MTRVEQTTVRETVQRLWADEVLPSLSGLVEIPALSQAFDADWAANGHLAAAVRHVREWITARDLPGAKIDVVEVDGRSPVLLVDVPATPGAEDRGTVLLYGHLDKQPRSAAGATGSARGPRWSATAGCTAAARPTTGTPATPRRRHWKPCTRRAAPMRDR